MVNAQLNLNKMEKTINERIGDFVKKHPNLSSVQYDGGACITSGTKILFSVEEKSFETKQEYLTALLILTTMPQFLSIYLDIQPK